jgi:precorrin-6x reductase
MILVFAGTKDGRDWVLDRLNKGDQIVVSVATDYGASLYPSHTHLHVVHGRKNQGEMQLWFAQLTPEQVVDATHPYAVEVSRNIQEACRALSLPYERILRETVLQTLDSLDVRTFDHYGAITDHLEKTQGNILWTIGSNALDQVMKPNLLLRSYVRVLPTSVVIKKCEALGLDARRILGMQGPFSFEMNQAIYRDLNIKHMVTKDSGTTGGTLEKVLPALEMGIQVLVYGRPNEEEGGDTP